VNDSEIEIYRFLWLFARAEDDFQYPLLSTNEKKELV